MTRAKPRTKGDRVRACVVLGAKMDRELSALAIATGESRSEIVARGIRLVQGGLSDKSQAAVECVRSVVDARGDEAASTTQGAA